MNQEKQRLRKQVAKKVNVLTSAEILELSAKILQRLKTSINWDSLDTVHIYQNILKLKEVHTTALISYIQERYPAVTIYAPADRQGEYHLVLSSIGHETHKVRTIVDLDLVIVPLVAFDKSLNRLGRGGGYYDRFLKNHPNAKKIGLAFEAQKVDKIPTESHDIKLDAVATEKAVYT